MRLDRYLMRHLPGTFSRVAVQRAIRQGLVHVDGRPAKAHRLLKAGQTVVANFEEERAGLPAAHAAQAGSTPARPECSGAGGSAAIVAEPISLEIVYEDDQLLVVNKPPGLVTHPAPGHWKGTLVNAIAWHLQQDAQGSGFGAQGTGPQPRAPSPERFPLHVA